MKEGARTDLWCVVAPGPGDAGYLEHVKGAYLECFGPEAFAAKFQEQPSPAVKAAAEAIARREAAQGPGAPKDAW
jgi:hypothetical protein